VILYIIGLVIGGLVVGALGRLLHPGRDAMSLPMTILLGIASMLIAGVSSVRCSVSAAASSRRS
jgi:uncharacterized membrane protein YeaQ/YmgE (transglycosylase-associated protein family)